MNKTVQETRDGMRIIWDAEIKASDGLIMRADVFMPEKEGKYPVILSYGPYAKNLSFQEGYKSQWLRVCKGAPNVLEGSSNKYQNWELVDPEKWCPDGYAVVRVDSRGTGCTPGVVDPWSPRESQDIYDSVEWAGTQSWSNGKVGINGISYYAMNQWHVAALKPPHLAACCMWEGSSDFYREQNRHGGILCDFTESWYKRQVASVQYGRGPDGGKSVVTGKLVTGDEVLPPEQLKKNAIDLVGELERREMDDKFYRDRSGHFDKIEVPFLSAANWGGVGLHPRGNIEGYLASKSKQKWLEIHGDTHFTLFYAQYGEDMQKKFFAHFLKGENNGWDKTPPVVLQVRSPGEKFVRREEKEWPLARTQWTKFYLDPDTKGFGAKEPAKETTLTYHTKNSDGVTFSTPPLTEPMEITGPVAAKLLVSSPTTDADVFLCLRVYDPQGKEVVFVGSNDPRTPVGLGWLRASHRKLDPAKTKPYRPYHTHDEKQPLTPNVPVELDVEIWPTSIVVPKGYRLALTVRGKAYEYDGTDAGIAHAPYPMKGVGPFTHENPKDRPPAVFHVDNTIHFKKGQMPYVLLPVIPKT